MKIETTVPPEFLENLHYMKDPFTARLLEMLVGLGGEVFLLKAEVELKLALAEQGTVGPAELEAAGAGSAFRQWIGTEQQAFAKSLLDPIARAAETRRPGRE